MASESRSESIEIQKSVKISGTVVDAAGEGVIGATVQQKGSSNATATGLNGSFQLSVPEGATLVVTYIGYQPQEVKAAQGMTVTLQEDVNKIEDVVVTAEFGLKRVARAVGSSVQNVKAQDIIESGRTDFVSALQGRVAGMTVTSTSGMPGASTQVVLRSMTSLSGSNQPLYVVDGVPMDNSSFDPQNSFAVADAVSVRDMDFSSRGNDLNPDDIESMTVLKGAAAAALYGSDASNGAIIITTKKGSNTDGKGVVSYRGDFSWSKAYGWPEIQDKYANGAYGATNYYYQNRFGGLIPDNVQVYDNVQAVLQTGFSHRHNVAVNAGKDKMSLRASAEFLSTDGVVKTTGLDRMTIRFGGKAEVNKWLNVDGSVAYIKSSNTKIGRGPSGPIYYAYLWPSVDDMSNWLAEDGMHMRLPDYYIDDDQINPLYGMYKNQNYDETDRATASLTAVVTPIKNTFIRASFGWDFSASNYIVARHPYYCTYNQTVVDSDNGGSYNISKNNLNNININLIAGYQNDWCDGRYSLSAQFGYHQTHQETNRLSSYGSNFLVIDLLSLNNCTPSTITSKKAMTTRRLQALSGRVELGYNNMAFLTVGARNDWSSTLPKENNSYFYPSIEGSFIFTEIKGLDKSKWLNYLKLRGAFSKVGKDASPLSIDPALEATELWGGGYKYGFTGPNKALVPEMNTSYEVGVEGRFVDDRINLDFTYYWQFCDDQIVNGFRMSYATGFVLNNLNVGSFKTWGWEGHIDADIIRADNGFRWNVGVNLSQNKSLVVDLPENLKEYYNAYTWNSGGLRNGIKEGYPITTITGLAYQRNKNGDILISPTSGTPLTESDWTVLGDRNPKLNFGATTYLSFKGFRLSAMVSGMFGASVVNGTMRTMMSKGQSWESVRLRENRHHVFEGVLKDGAENSDNPTKNTIAVDMLHYAGTQIFAGGDEDWFEKNVNYLKLAEVRLNYTVPTTWLKKATKGFISKASVFVAANDLCTLTNYSGVDPVGNTMSAAGGGTGGQGYDVWGIPAPRTYSFGVNLSF
ncbi:MAG: SusC/RagA family TonB-linked outer membrane protein [Alistipes sp.]|nr:SusC/RagA family TonB-linked outer membrane protein [Alistipes sp.]